MKVSRWIKKVMEIDFTGVDTDGGDLHAFDGSALGCDSGYTIRIKNLDILLTTEQYHQLFEDMKALEKESQK